MLSTLSFVALAAATALTTAPTLVQAKYECDTSLGTYYPYCINVPDGASSSDKLPTIVFLSGSGARGPASNVKSLSGYDGFGKLINQYLSGNKGEAQTMAAEKFVVVIPISPQNDGGQEVRHWWPEKLDDVYSDLKSKGYPIDWDQLHLSGYSMGGRGTWRNAVARPDLYASLAPSAGAAEKPGDGTLSQQKADSVFDKLDLIKDIPVMQFAGSSDSTAGGEPPKSTEAELKKIGNSLASLVMESTDHSGMSTIPFDTTLMNWMLEQKKSGASSSVSSSTDDITSGSSNDDEDENEDSSSSSSSSSKGGISKTRTSSSPSKTSSGSSSKFTQDAEVKVAVDSGSSTSGKKKCSSSASARRRRAKRAAQLEEGYAFAHPGPVRRGILPAPNAKPALKKRGLSLADIIASSEKHQAEAEKKKRSLEENVKAHTARSHSSSSGHSKFGRRLSR